MKKSSFNWIFNEIFESGEAAKCWWKIIDKKRKGAKHRNIGNNLKLMSESNATYSQIHIQIIFAVKFRDALLKDAFKEEVYKYITGIIQNNNHKVLAINGMPDHLHILIGLRPNQALANLVNEIKSNSSKFINEKKFLPVRFEWQKGYGAFSYGKSQINDVVNYINNQEKHHQKKSFKEEYLDFLTKFEVEYNEEYIFNDLK